MSKLANDKYRILEEAAYISTSDSKEPLSMMYVTFQTTEGLIDSVIIPKELYDKGNKQRLIEEILKQRGQ